MAISVIDENSKSIPKFLLLFKFRNNFKQDNNQINIYKCLANNKLTFFIILVKIAIRK